LKKHVRRLLFYGKGWKSDLYADPDVMPDESGIVGGASSTLTSKMLDSHVETRC
jgi:hypothetical protein